jgi:hypothetical protein
VSAVALPELGLDDEAAFERAIEIRQELVAAAERDVLGDSEIVFSVSRALPPAVQAGLSRAGRSHSLAAGETVRESTCSSGGRAALRTVSR